MAATATKMSQSVMVKEKEWVNLFPKQATENYTSSVTFMKQLTVVAISMITYMKNAFPEDNYNTEPFAGLQLKILNINKCSDDLAHFVSTALLEAFEAFDKKYIHQLALCFYENSCEPENLIEYHIFEYSYTPEGVVLNINSKNRNSDSRSMKCSLDKVKARTTMFIRSLSMYVLAQSHMELPVNYDVSLRLYYNEDAPEGYQAPGFSSTEALDPLEPTLHHAIRLGWVETPYHSLVARSYTRDPLPASDEAVPSDNTPAMTQAEGIDFQGSPGERGLQCACNQDDIGDHALITCQYCHKQQHAVCFGYLSRAPAAHCCVACAAADPRRAPGDRRLAELDPTRRECLSIFRRTLALCARAPRVSGAALAPALALALPAHTSARIMRLLQGHGVVPPAAGDDLTIQRKINHGRLKQVIKRYFQDEDEELESVVERLVAETAAAGDDPFGDVLSPLEKISLHNTTLGQVIAPPPPESHADDETLQQYRQAVPSEDISEEPPLSGSHNPVKDVQKIGKRKSTKRKNEDDDWLPKSRSGIRTKKIRVKS